MSCLYFLCINENIVTSPRLFCKEDLLYLLFTLMIARIMNTIYGHAHVIFI